MAFAARSEGVTLPPLQLAVRNEILLGRGFGSSAAAIVAGVKLCGLIGERELSNEKVLEHATRFRRSSGQCGCRFVWRLCYYVHH